ncbi:MAG TPA: PilZ domain-containing protein [Myxococcota bacterium]|nr:PilZ domain-containing protein [Myxococcota bacterium]
MKQVLAATPRCLLVHDGELADVRALLVSLAVPFVERVGAESADDRRHPWDLVIASARRILELQIASSPTPPAQIAILAHDARTLRSSLRRSGTTLMVRRPVHPAALRALVVHSLYRGPEKRRSARVDVGAPVRVKMGWRAQPAVLLDLSVSGCRLLTDRPIDPGSLFRLQMPARVAGGRPLSVEARVVECAPGGDQTPARCITTATFTFVSARLHAHLHAAVAAHAEGPARFDGATGIEPVGVAAAAEGCGAERRESDRHRLDRSVASLGDEAARVLMGRDLSRGGMRVNPNPMLVVGMKLSLAVHAETRDAPLILHAVVDRDDGERGLVLRFCDLSAELSRYLDYVIHALPLVIDDDDDEGCLVAELLEAG